MSEELKFTDLFERTINLPDPDAQERLSRLIGIDENIRQLATGLGALVNSDGIRKWAKDKHPDAPNLLDLVQRRPPLVILSGDVGSGKTELAETIGDRVARDEKIEIKLLPLSLTSRGKGMVGEMTSLITTAFEHTFALANKMKATTGKARGAVILLIDEADALAQSRESEQMHHEDRAGVNALIRGVDRLANGKVPAVVLMCTNRLKALDPAVRRRAADIFVFERPNDQQRLNVLTRFLEGIGLTSKDLGRLASITGPSESRPGFTYSDFIQRFIPRLVLDAYPSKSITAAQAISLATSMSPTPPFADE